MPRPSPLRRHHLQGAQHATPLRPCQLATAALPPQVLKLAAVERDLLRQALERARNNKSEAARLLGLSRGQLYSLLRRHGLGAGR